MEKRGSVGVTIFAWLFMISGMYGIVMLSLIRPSHGNFRDLSLYYGTCLTSAATLASGFFIFRLKPIGRKTILVLCVISMLTTLMYLMPFSKKIDFDKVYEQRKQEIMQQTKPEFQKQKLAELEKAQVIGRKVTPVLLFVVGILPSVIFNLFTIYYFTRRRVVEQFKGIETVSSV